MTKHIIVGVDRSAAASAAVAWAAAEAELLGASLRIIACHQMPAFADPAGASGYAEAIASLQEGATATADSAERAVRADHPRVRVSSASIAGSTARALLDGVGRDDLVVVGASRHADAAAFWLGSTPRALVRRSPCPVVVVRPNGAGAGGAGSVLVGVDGSAASRAALIWAGDEAQRRQVPLDIVHAWEYPYPSTQLHFKRVRELTEIDAACVLEREAEFARDRLSCPVTARLVEAAPGVALLQADQCALVVVGSRGRGALRSAISGSTATLVLEHALAPVVVVPSA